MALETTYFAAPPATLYSKSSGTSKLIATTSSSALTASSSLIKPTFFPSINSGMRKIISNYNADKKRLVPEDQTRKKWVLSDWHAKRPSPELALVGTVKLHGVHIDLVFDDPLSSTFRIQSRNVPALDAGNDIFEVVATLRKPEMENTILGIRHAFIARYKIINSKVNIDETNPLIIAGEWVGPGIHKSVALAQFPAKAFVLLNFKVNDAWISNMAFFSEIHAVNHGILNVTLGGFFEVKLLVDQPQACFAQVEEITLRIEKECPFAKAAGRLVGQQISGVGEGIVWRLASPSSSQEASERYWVKTKGPFHADVEKTKLPATFDTPAKEKAKAFACATVQETRLEGRWVELLGLCGGKVNASNTGKFMEILAKDIEKEESEEMKQLEINVIEARKEVGVLGKIWFQARLKALN